MSTLVKKQLCSEKKENAITSAFMRGKACNKCFGIFFYFYDIFMEHGRSPKKNKENKARQAWEKKLSQRASISGIKYVFPDWKKNLPHTK